MKPIIEVKNLTKHYKNFRALNELTFDVYEGEILGLLGPNGSGKSTTINCLLSLLKHEKGEIKVLGKEMTPEAYDIKSKIGVVFQDVAVYDELTVYENINYFCGLYITDKKIREEYIKEAIDLVQLNEFRNFYPKQLSGGLLRRLNIACGIAHKPTIIILDEPTVAVDPQSRNNILDGIKKLNEKGATIIYTSHYMEEVEQICDRIIILDKGQIVASGNKQELKELVNIKEKITVELEDANLQKLSEIKDNPNVAEINLNNSTLFISYNVLKQNLKELIDYFHKNDIKYSSIFSELPTLNDVFLELTGKELRD